MTYGSRKISRLSSSIAPRSDLHHPSFIVGEELDNRKDLVFGVLSLYKVSAAIFIFCSLVSVKSFLKRDERSLLMVGTIII